MKKALVPIAAALYTGLTWAQSPPSSTSQTVGGVRTFRGAIIDARCAPSDKSDDSSAAVSSPTGFANPGSQSNAPGNASATSQSGRPVDRNANSKASQLNQAANQSSQAGQRDMGVSNDRCQPSQTTRMFALRTVDGRIISFDDTSNTKAVGQFLASLDSSNVPVQSSPTGELSPGSPTANPGRASAGQVEVIGRLEGNRLQVQTIRPVQ
jgi:hypothetical protein